MSSKNWIYKLQTAYRNFYRPLRIDDAIRRREILAILYGISAFCLYVCVRSRTHLMAGELSKVKPDAMEDGVTLRYVNGELTEIIRHHK